MPPDQTVMTPWYAAALWAAIVVFGFYALFLLLTVVFPRGWGWGRAKQARNQTSGIRSQESGIGNQSANGEMEK